MRRYIRPDFAGIKAKCDKLEKSIQARKVRMGLAIEPRKRTESYRIPKSNTVGWESRRLLHGRIHA